jgi:hypothetical protein
LRKGPKDTVEVLVMLKGGEEGRMLGCDGSAREMDSLKGSQEG